MNLEDPRWEEWEAAFNVLAEDAEQVTVTGEVKGAQHYLCLVGENGLSPEDEFAELDRMAARASEIKKIVLDLDFWQDTILFIP